MKNVIIIGASHSAAQAISSLRRAGWSEKITLVGDEQVLPYERPPLSKAYFSGTVDADRLLIKKAEFYETAQVDLFLGHRAISIDRQEQLVTLDDGEQLSYSKLIFATGTRARTLQIEGSGVPELNYLRDLNDANQIKRQVKSGTKLLTIGAGYIGLEIAASAIKQGAKVTVLEAMDRVLQRVTSPVISEFYQTLHAQHGVDIRLGSSLLKFASIDSKNFALLANQQQIEFDCIVVGIGVIPNSELAEQAGLSCDNGILVDEYTQTDDPNIYAVGDCCNHPSALYDRRIRLESVPNANAQAKTAALAICGNRVAYNQLPWFWSDQYDIKLQTAGLLQGYDEAIVNGDIKENKFSVAYMKNDKMIALDAINSPAEFMKAKKLITTNLSG
ncbi:MAG: FAD-dependent oxidoreductase [Acidiferrobacterales bacterium]|nr:FAD-dependent oxidoreductase [Acidiferrobacterales bacterium]